ncbi:MAG TPA: aldehyde dehydrogenase family protein, partial [Rhizomicrobium sp.]
MTHPVPKVESSLPVISHYIGGKAVGSSRPPFENRNPATGAIATYVHEADAAVVDQAVRAARAALRGPWGKFTDPQRAAVLRKVADGIRARFDDFLAAEIRDTGKPANLASHLDIPRGA